MDGTQIEAGTTLRRTERAVPAVRLNPAGAWIWEQLEQPRQVGELASGLAQRFEIDEDRALGDVVAFAREMARRDLLVAS